jgi:hypothetical protein
VKSSDDTGFERASWLSKHTEHQCCQSSGKAGSIASSWLPGRPNERTDRSVTEHLLTDNNCRIAACHRHTGAAVGSESESVRPYPRCTRRKNWPYIGRIREEYWTATGLPQSNLLRVAQSSHVQKDRMTTSEERCQKRQTSARVAMVASHGRRYRRDPVAAALRRRHGQSLREGQTVLSGRPFQWSVMA